MGGIGFEKDEDSLRVAIQPGQSESKTRILIEGEGIVWPHSDLDDFGNLVMKEAPDEAAGDEMALRVSEVKVGKCTGYVQRNDEKFTMNHAMAFQSVQFDEPVTVVYVSEKPFRTRSVPGTKVDELMIFDLRATDQPPSMEMRIQGDYVSISCFVGSHSINISGPDFKSEAVLKDGRLQGKVFSPKPHEFFDDTFQFSVDLDVELMKVAEASAPTTLSASEDYEYPVPFGSNEVSRESTPYRTVIRGSLESELATMVDFYRTQLAESGWEESGAAKLSEKAANMSFSRDGEVLAVQLRTTSRSSEFALAAQNANMAKKDGVLPKAGQAKALLGNATEAEIVIMIDDVEYKLPIGVGSENPADAKKIDLKPGKHTIVIKVPGEKPQTEQVDIKPNTTWGFVAFGNEGYFAQRVY